MRPEAVVLSAGKGGQVTLRGRARGRGLEPNATRGTVLAFKLGVQNQDCIRITWGDLEKHRLLNCPPLLTISGGT